jgi:hypothetical protein
MAGTVSARRNGFTPARDYDAKDVRTYPVATQTNYALGIGDAVHLTDGLVAAVTAGMDPGQSGFGVVIGVLNTDGRPFTFNQPTNGPFIASGATGFAQVLWNPDMSYTVRYEGSAGNGVVGKNVEVTANGVTTKTGRSTMGVQVATSASDGLLFKVIGLSPFEGITGVTAARGNDKYVEVVWNKHILKGGTADQ